MLEFETFLCQYDGQISALLVNCLLHRLNIHSLPLKLEGLPLLSRRIFRIFSNKNIYLHHAFNFRNDFSTLQTLRHSYRFKIFFKIGQTPNCNATRKKDVCFVSESTSRCGMNNGHCSLQNDFENVLNQTYSFSLDQKVHNFTERLYIYKLQRMKYRI